MVFGQTLSSKKRSNRTGVGKSRRFRQDFRLASFRRKLEYSNPLKKAGYRLGIDFYRHDRMFASGYAVIPVTL